MNIAIIPARSKSVRIKNKNVKYFYGKPIIYWSILAAKKTKLFDKIVVSTDDKKIINLVKKFGVDTPFVRPKKLSGNFVGVLPVIKHAIRKLKIKNDNANFCCIFSASPNIKFKNIIKGFNLLRKSKKGFIFPATKNDDYLARSFYFKRKGLKMLSDEFYKKRSQDLPDTFHDTGQFYWATKKTWLSSKRIFSKDSKILEIPNSESIDINNLENWKKALRLFKR